MSALEYRMLRLWGLYIGHIHCLKTPFSVLTSWLMYLLNYCSEWLEAEQKGSGAGIFCLRCSVQFSSVAQSCPTLCNTTNRSMPGLPVHHQLPEFTQTHVHWVGDAIQPSHPLSSPSPPAPNPSQHESFPMSQLFAWGGQSIGVSASTSVLPIEHPGLISFRIGWLDLLAVQGTLKSLLQHHSSKHQFFGAQLSSQSNSHIHTWPLQKP